MPSFEPGRKRGAEYHIFGAACGRDSRERESKRALFEHDPYIITGGPMAGRTAENDCGCERMVPVSVRKRDLCYCELIRGLRGRDEQYSRAACMYRVYVTSSVRTRPLRSPFCLQHCFNPKISAGLRTQVPSTSDLSCAFFAPAVWLQMWCDT